MYYFIYKGIIKVLNGNKYYFFYVKVFLVLVIFGYYQYFCYMLKCEKIFKKCLILFVYNKINFIIIKIIF